MLSRKADHQLTCDMAKESYDALIRPKDKANTPNKDHEEDEDEEEKELEDGNVEPAAGGA
eukprot:5051437-Pyramimonas_sp.AAC.1